MSTKALSGLRDYICGSLSFANILWLCKQLTDYVQQQQKTQNNPLPHTKEELNAALDEAERQFKNGEYVTNEEVMRWIKDERINVKSEHLL